MRVTPFLFLICALSLHPARAQFATKEAPSTPIHYSRDVPQSVLKLMPRGATSLFWGKFSPKGSGLMAIHLYDLGSTPSSTEGFITQRRFGVDVFDTSPHLHKINRVEIDYRTDTELPLFELELFWMKKSEFKQPVLKIRCFTNDGFEGPIGDEVFAFFYSGWRGHIRTHSGAWGVWHGADTAGGGNHAYYDDNGELQIETYVVGYN